jgi:hypothetical protein
VEREAAVDLEETKLLPPEHSELSGAELFTELCPGKSILGEKVIAVVVWSEQIVLVLFLFGSLLVLVLADDGLDTEIALFFHRET